MTQFAPLPSTTSHAAAAPIGMDGPGRMLAGALAALDRSAVPYCITHGFESLVDRVEGDVDLLVPAGALPKRLAAALRQYQQMIGGVPVQWLRDSAHFIVLAGKNPDGTPCFLQLHAARDYELNRRMILPLQTVLTDHRQQQFVRVPAPDVALCVLLSRRIAKGRISDDDVRKVADMFRQAPTHSRSRIEKLWGKRRGRVLIDALESGQWSPVHRSMPALRRILLRRARLRHPVRWFGNVLGAAMRKINRMIKPDRGLNVVLLGPDGSGKSSVQRAVCHDLAPAFVESERRSFPPAILNRKGTGSTNPNPHDIKPRGFVHSTLRAALYWFGYHRFIAPIGMRRTLARNTLIMHDRHMLDALVDPKRYRYGGPMWLLRLLTWLIPKPDLVIFLDAPADMVQQRKAEVPLHETQRQLDAYRRLVTRMRQGRVVDASRPLGQVVAQVNDVILEHLAQRTSKQMRLGEIR
jgi:thymidylate kinase